MSDNTIVAVSTPHGMGGIAVVRVSGDDALACVQRRWKGKALEAMMSHTAHLGHLVDSDGNVLDEVLLTVFRAPNTFTGDDVVEISCHGSLWIQQQIVNTLIEAGCRGAEAGEFTRRAFANGRMDLSQAEAVADVIASQSAASHRVAMNQMRGAFAAHLAQLRSKLLDFTSLVELELDFSEEDVEFADRSRLTALAREIARYITTLAESYKTGNAIKHGVPVAIIGATNAGKSTLLNALVGDQRALVSDIHGTTRDVIEDTITLGGTLFRLIDTAGIRQSNDVIEAMGIERSFQKMDQAAIVVWVVDGTSAPDEVAAFHKAIAPHLQGKKVLALVNKSDLLDDGFDAQALVQQPLESMLITAHSPRDVEQLSQRLVEMADIPEVNNNTLIVVNARHYEALTRAAEAIARVVDALDNGMPGDLLSQDLRECLHHLGEITGEITSSEVIQTIFSRFCIGK